MNTILKQLEIIHLNIKISINLSKDDNKEVMKKEKGWVLRIENS